MSLLGILLALARTSGLRQNVCHIKNPMSWLLSATEIFMIWQHFSTKIPKVRVQLPEWWIMLHLYVWQCVQVWGKWLHTLPSHPTWDEPQGSCWGMLTNNNICFPTPRTVYSDSDMSHNSNSAPQCHSPRATANAFLHPTQLAVTVAQLSPSP